MFYFFLGMLWLFPTAELAPFEVYVFETCCFECFLDIELQPTNQKRKRKNSKY